MYQRSLTLRSFPLRWTSVVLVILLIFPGLAQAKKVPTGLFNTYAYKLKTKKIVKGIDRDSSGLTYDPTSKSLFLLDDKQTIFELSLEGTLIREIPLSGFHDTEGIAYIKKNTFAIVEERVGDVTVITIKDSTDNIDKSKSQTYQTNLNYGNFGIEAMIYDPADEIYYLFKEQDPKGVYTLVFDQEKMKILQPFNGDLLPTRDLSGAALNVALSEHLFILSERSKRVLEVTRQGEVLSSFSFISQLSFGKPEGLAFDEEGRMYIVAEHGTENFLCFEPEKRTKSSGSTQP